MKKLSAILTFVIALSGCATSLNELEYATIYDLEYEKYTCEELTVELIKYAGAADKAITIDASSANSVGGGILQGMFALLQEDDHTVDIDYHNAIERVAAMSRQAKKKNCDPESLTSSDAQLENVTNSEEVEEEVEEEAEAS